MKTKLNKNLTRAGDMVQWLRVGAALPGDLSLISSQVTYNRWKPLL